MTYHVYMLKSLGKKTVTYVGYTNNLKLRLIKHNSNKGAKSTKGYKWILVYSKNFKSKRQAMSYEYSFKKNYKLRKKIIDQYKNEKH